MMGGKHMEAKDCKMEGKKMEAKAGCEMKHEGCQKAAEEKK